jgi:nitrogen fixation protein NifU and related proteins
VSRSYADDLVAEARRDVGRGSLASPRITARNANPSCGDEIEMDIDHDGVRISAIAHRTRGCAFTHASASLIARFVPDMTLVEARQLATDLQRDVPRDVPLPSVFAALATVRMYPARKRCALLPWEALAAALLEV